MDLFKLHKPFTVPPQFQIKPMYYGGPHVLFKQGVVKVGGKKKRKAKTPVEKVAEAGETKRKTVDSTRE